MAIHKIIKWGKKKGLHNKWVNWLEEEHNGSKQYKIGPVVKGF